MKNIVAGSYQVWFPGKQIWELWFIDRGKEPRLVDTCSDANKLAFKGWRRRILAVPTPQQISLTFISAAFVEEKLITGARNRVLREGIQCDLEGIGIQPVSGIPPRTLVRIDVPTGETKLTEFDDNLNPDFMVPAASLLPIPGNGMATWTELGKSVFAVGKNGITVHYGELRGDRNVDRAREIRRLMEKLQSRKLVTPQSALHLWDQSGPDLFKEILPNRVYAGNRAAPTNFQASIGMRPDHYRKNEVQKRHRTRKLFRKCAVGFAIATAALLVAGTYRMAYSQIRVQKEYIEKLQPETVRIDRIRSQWAEMAPAVDRNASVLEVWRKIFTLPSSSHVRISRMKIGMDAIELVCETESGVKALRFIDEMSRSDSLSHFTWNYTTPEEYADGTSRFELKGFRL